MQEYVHTQAEAPCNFEVCRDVKRAVICRASGSQEPLARVAYGGTKICWEQLGLETLDQARRDICEGFALSR